MNKKTERAAVTSSLASIAPQSKVVEIVSDTEPPHRKVEPIAHVLEHYLASIRGIGQTAQIALPHITKWKFAEIEKIQKKIEKFVPETPKEGNGHKTFTLDSARDFAEFTSTIRQLEELRSQNSTEVLSKSLFTQLFAEFDAYIGELLKVIYLKNDKLLKGISREIALSDLLDFDDLKAVKLSMLDKEIETFRRDSYVEQFSTLEKKFNLSLRRFSEWPDFVELSQRRNILTHNGGMYSGPRFQDSGLSWTLS